MGKDCFPKEKSTSTREDVERKISEKIRKEVLGGNLNVEKIIEEVQKNLQSNNESVQEVMKNSIKVRGSIIEASIHLEGILNEIILQYYNPRDHNNFKRDFLFKTLSLSQKKDIINTIIKNENLKERLSISKDFGKGLEEFVKIRNIYAHYPEDVFDKSGHIEISHKEFKSIPELTKVFFDLVQELFKELHKISIFVAEEVIKYELGKNKDQ